MRGEERGTNQAAVTSRELERSTLSSNICFTHSLFVRGFLQIKVNAVLHNILELLYLICLRRPLNYIHVHVLVLYTQVVYRRAVPVVVVCLIFLYTHASKIVAKPVLHIENIQRAYS